MDRARPMQRCRRRDRRRRHGRREPRAGACGARPRGRADRGASVRPVGQPSFDDRTTALSNASRRIFEALGVWPLLEREAAAIRPIHVSDAGASASRASTRRSRGRARSATSSSIASSARRCGSGSDRAPCGSWRRRGCAACSSSTGGSASIAIWAAQDTRYGRSAARRRRGRRAIGAARSSRHRASTWDYEQTALVTNVLTAALPRSRRLRALHALGPAGGAADDAKDGSG